MSSLAYNPFAFQILDDNTWDMDPEAYGIFSRLILESWKQRDCRIPNDDAWICRMLRIHKNKWNKYRNLILDRFFELTDDGAAWINKELTKWREFAISKSEQAKAAAQVRWGNTPAEEPQPKAETGLHRGYPTQSKRAVSNDFNGLGYADAYAERMRQERAEKRAQEAAKKNKRPADSTKPAQNQEGILGGSEGGLPTQIPPQTEVPEINNFKDLIHAVAHADAMPYKYKEERRTESLTDSKISIVQIQEQTFDEKHIETFPAQITQAEPVEQPTVARYTHEAALPVCTPSTEAKTESRAKTSLLGSDQLVPQTSAKLVEAPQEAAQEESGIEGDFEVFWSFVPKNRKDGKKPAFKAFKRTIKSRAATAETMIAGMKRYAAWCDRNGRQPQFIKMASTWINGHHWDDQLSDDGIGERDVETGLRHVSKQTKMLADMHQSGVNFKSLWRL